MPAKRIVFEEMLPESPDYRSLVTRLLGKKPEASTFILNVQNAIPFLKALKEQGGLKDVSLICDANTEFNLPDYEKALGLEIFEGCLATAMPNRMTDKFTEAFKKNYGEEPATFADYAYDAAAIMEKLAAYPKDEWKEIPVVVLSAVNDMDIIRKSRDLGVTEYITKPLNIHKLIELTRTLLKN